MKTITLAIQADGTASLLHGPEVPIKAQRKTVHTARNSTLPEGAERLEIWERKCVKQAVSSAVKSARKARIAAAIEAKSAAKPAAPKKPKSPKAPKAPKPEEPPAEEPANETSEASE